MPTTQNGIINQSITAVQGIHTAHFLAFFGGGGKYTGDAFWISGLGGCDETCCVVGVELSRSGRSDD